MLLGLAVDLVPHWAMLLEIGGEAGVASGVADEIQIVGPGRVKRGAEESDSRVGDQCGQRAWPLVGSCSETGSDWRLEA